MGRFHGGFGQVGVWPVSTRPSAQCCDFFGTSIGHIWPRTSRPSRSRTIGIWSLSVTSHAQLVSILWYLLLILTRDPFLIHSMQSREECLLHIAHVNTLHINTPPQCVNAIRFIKQCLFKSYLSVHQEYVSVSECIATANSPEH